MGVRQRGAAGSWRGQWERVPMGMARNAHIRKSAAHKLCRNRKKKIAEKNDHGLNLCNRRWERIKQGVLRRAPHR